MAHETATGAVRRNMPGPVLVHVPGRLAIDRQVPGMALGAAQGRDAVKRTMGVSANTGVRALPVHALSGRANRFCVRHGFQASTLHSLTFVAPVASLMLLEPAGRFQR